ncbi:type II secretion system minor pseudopilin GspJ [Tahibacter soli]|uniref:Type II secretion system protein J n=1 Tax=Tahibacter soli TaxID=2983605 RepID=A0A9X4BMS0_9GAMM|nr:type II secretion system minor pseudopilin GspJ [Tahibacter soli]MDC8015644.1 type II secretion system minor pseudopilin GspJ [Tahibacter soli]
MNARRRGFTLVEVLVATAVFAAMSALAWGGLNAVIRARAALVDEQQAFAQIQRAVGAFERDVQAVVARPVRGNYGEVLPALVGDGDSLEFTRLGYGGPNAARSALERVLYQQDGKKLRRGRYPVLDRAAGTLPVFNDVRDGVRSLRLRYLDPRGRWLDAWPPRDVEPDALPRAVELRVDVEGLGEITRLVETPGRATPGGAAP